VKHYTTRNQVIIEMFLAEFREKHLVDDALFLIDSALWLQAPPHRYGLDYRYKNMVIGIVSNVSSKN